LEEIATKIVKVEEHIEEKQEEQTLYEETMGLFD